MTEETSPAEGNAMRSRLKNQACCNKQKSIFVMASAGIAKDSWTIHVNAVVDDGRMIKVDENGFLHVVPASQNSQTSARAGLGG